MSETLINKANLAKIYSNWAQLAGQIYSNQKQLQIFYFFYFPGLRPFIKGEEYSLVSVLEKMAPKKATGKTISTHCVSLTIEA